MDKKVLVLYASKHGSTSEIAQKIGEALRRNNLQAEVYEAGAAPDAAPYDAVILGSCVYIGLWHKKAVRFLKRNVGLLARQAVWLFSSGPTGPGNPLDLTDGWLYPKKLEPIIAAVKPRGMTCFGGKLVLQTLNPFEKWIINKVKAAEGDYRDWEAVVSWADTIARDIKAV